MDISSRLSSVLEGLSKRIQITTFGNANQRLVSFLLYLNSHCKEIKFTHEEIANLIGLTRERVSIEMKKLIKSKLISCEHHLIKIPSKEKLITKLQI